MWKQIRLLVWLQLCNTFGRNEIRCGKDRKKRNRLRLLLVAIALVWAVIVLYVCGGVYGCIQLGMGSAVPACLCGIISLAIFFFTMFRAGDTLFNMRTYERTIVLPISSRAIVLSRFLSLYAINAAISLLVVIPGVVIYGIFLRPGPGFYGMMLAGTLLIPLLPMTAACALGALIYAAAARMRHKNLVVIVLSVAALLGFLVGTSVLSYRSESLSAAQLEELASAAVTQIAGVYPPAAVFGRAAVDMDVGALALFAALSVLPFLLLSAIVERKFAAICSALSASAGGGRYVMARQTRSAPWKALFRRELARYFASSIYVLNTSVGYLLMVLFAAAILAAGVDRIESMMGMSGLLQRASPFILALMCAIAPSTASAVSIEGKQWWITLSLPVRTETVLNAKLLVNLTLALPCWAAAEVMLWIALPMNPTERFFQLAIPLVYLLFSAVLGLNVNLHMPIFNWDSETTVVKQSGAVLVTMLVGMVSAGVPLALALALGNAGYLVCAAACILPLAAAALLYRNSCRFRLSTVDRT